MSKKQFLNEYNNLLAQGIHEIYAKIILAEKYKDIIDVDEIVGYLAEENDELAEAIATGGFVPLHLSENNISINSIDEKEESCKAETETETETEANSKCETKH